MATLLGMMLSQSGFDFDLAHDTSQARAMLARHTYDGMTLDIMLPHQDGLSFLREMRASRATRDLPVVIVSAQAAESQQESDNDGLGAVEWLNKPINATRLVAALQRCIVC